MIDCRTVKNLKVKIIHAKQRQIDLLQIRKGDKKIYHSGLLARDRAECCVEPKTEIQRLQNTLASIINETANTAMKMMDDGLVTLIQWRTGNDYFYRANRA